MARLSAAKRLLRTLSIWLVHDSGGVVESGSLEFREPSANDNPDERRASLAVRVLFAFDARPPFSFLEGTRPDGRRRSSAASD